MNGLRSNNIYNTITNNRDRMGVSYIGNYIAESTI